MHDDLIKGKRCIVVAPSRYLRGRGKASADFIDSFDLVVKTTDMCEMRDPIGELGMRCDVWYGMPGNASGWRVSLDALKTQGVKLMVLQPRLQQYEKAWLEYVNWIEAQTLPTTLQYTFADKSFYDSFVKQLNSVPLSGIFAIFDLLQRGAAQVFAYGHDFYRSGYFFDSDFMAKTTLSDWHHLDSQMQAVWKLKQCDPRFDCDENLNYLMNQKYLPDFDESSAFIQLIQKELNFFGQSFEFGHVLLLRTCNINWFRQILDVLASESTVGKLEVIAQSSVLSLLPKYDGRFTVHSYAAGEQFKQCDLKTGVPFNAGQLDTVFVPYNGLELWTYQDVFEYCRYLKVKNVFLISQRGVVRRIEDIDNECQSITEYLALRNQFNQYVQRYDRRQCL